MCFRTCGITTAPRHDPDAEADCRGPDSRRRRLKLKVGVSSLTRQSSGTSRRVVTNPGSGDHYHGGVPIATFRTSLTLRRTLGNRRLRARSVAGLARRLLSSALGTALIVTGYGVNVTAVSTGGLYHGCPLTPKGEQPIDKSRILGQYATGRGDQPTSRTSTAWLGANLSASGMGSAITGKVVCRLRAMGDDTRFRTSATDNRWDLGIICRTTNTVADYATANSNLAAIHAIRCRIESHLWAPLRTRTAQGQELPHSKRGSVQVSACDRFVSSNSWPIRTRALHHASRNHWLGNRIASRLTCLLLDRLPSPSTKSTSLSTLQSTGGWRGSLSSPDGRIDRAPAATLLGTTPRT